MVSMLRQRQYHERDCVRLPTLPILFDFFNSNLVDQPIDHLGGASASIDDYFRRKAGPIAAKNLRKIQDKDIPHIEEWLGKTAQNLLPRKQSSSTSRGEKAG